VPVSVTVKAGPEPTAATEYSLAAPVNTTVSCGLSPAIVRFGAEASMESANELDMA
jgi:hypothetical protein